MCIWPKDILSALLFFPLQCDIICIMYIVGLGEGLVGFALFGIFLNKFSVTSLSLCKYYFHTPASVK